MEDLRSDKIEKKLINIKNKHRCVTDAEMISFSNTVNS